MVCRPYANISPAPLASVVPPGGVGGGNGSGSGGDSGNKASRKKERVAAFSGGKGSSIIKNGDQGGQRAEEGWRPSLEDNFGLPLLARGGAVEKGAGSPTPPTTSSRIGLLRGRYDRELLAVLEEEQEAEGARERVLAAAKARAKVAQARAKYNNSSMTLLPNSAGAAADVDSDGHRGGVGLQLRGVVSQADGGNLGTGQQERSLRGNTRETNAAAMAAATCNDKADGEQRRWEEAVGAKREVKRLEEKLARERREASERVMRVSEAYEEGLQQLSEGKHRAQDVAVPY